MCGIFGCIGVPGCAPLLRQALKRLEYRGYDSAGIATIHGGRLYVKKDSGKIDEIHSKLNFDDLLGDIGIAHTRWATHGAPTAENAHPHIDCRGEVAVVHNGVIENFFQLREELRAKGHVFKSETDTEVFAHLIEDGLAGGLSLLEATRRATMRVRGSYAIIVMSTREPDTLVCARNESPLIIGLGKEAMFCASDIPAFLPLTRNAIYLEDREIALLKRDSVKLYKLDTLEAVVREPEVVRWSPRMAEREGYPHFMLKEIYEQPRGIRDALRTPEIYLNLVAAELDTAEHVFLVACGTSYHACLVASYAFSKLAKLATQPVIASEFVEHYGSAVDESCAVLAVSQSGETADTLAAVRFARARGASVAGIVNVLGSSLTMLSKVYVCQSSGPEIGVAATKTFTAQLAVLSKLVLKLSERRGALDRSEINSFFEKLHSIPELADLTLKRCGQAVERIASKYAARPSFCFLGRGVSYPVALEGRLKLLELAYTPSLAYPAGESKHGFISVVEEGYPVVFVAPNDRTRPKMVGNIMEMKARGASVIVIAEEGDEEIMQLADDYVEIPSQGVPESLTPMLFAIPLQLFAYYVAVKRGHDPDKPRSLAKAVTVE